MHDQILKYNHPKSNLGYTKLQTKRLTLKTFLSYFSDLFVRLTLLGPKTSLRLSPLRGFSNAGGVIKCGSLFSPSISRCYVLGLMCIRSQSNNTKHCLTVGKCQHWLSSHWVLSSRARYWTLSSGSRYWGEGEPKNNLSLNCVTNYDC